MYIRKIFVFLFCSSLLSFSEVHLPAFFSDGMVLQCETSAPIWGKGVKNAPVRVEFAGQVIKSESDENGYWRVSLKGLKASKQGGELNISVGGEEKVITDVLVGEVWIASGQSNMEWTMEKTDSAAYAKTVNLPMVKQFVGLKNVASEKEEWNLQGHWAPAVDGAPSNFSAVAFHFAEEVSNSLDVPVGIVELAWGGKPVESFMSEEVITNLAVAKKLVEEKQKRIKAYPSSLKNIKKAEEVYIEALEKWKQDGKKGKEPKRPKKPVAPQVNPSLHSTIFNGMISPVVGYGARGVIWYQGESNTNWTAEIYSQLIQAMVADWRSRWGVELSFYQVQLANHLKFKNKNTDNKWVIVQDQQRRSLSVIPQSGMVVINDIGALKNIHPRNKKDVGFRLARWAKFFDYMQKDVLYSGPLFKQAEFRDGSAIVSFDYDQGMKSSDGIPLRSFELAGKGENWVPAEAKVIGNTVVVNAESLANPQKVRYAWRENAEEANLTNSSGLPASCFTSER